MENTVNSRVLMLKTKLGLTDVEFCGRASISTFTLNKIKNEEDVTQKVLTSIINAYSLNRDWLMTGKGKMFVEKQQEQAEPWRDEAFKALKEEVAFYRQLLLSGNGKTSFLRALNKTGSFKKEFLRADAA